MYRDVQIKGDKTRIPSVKAKREKTMKKNIIENWGECLFFVMTQIVLACYFGRGNYLLIVIPVLFIVLLILTNIMVLRKRQSELIQKQAMKPEQRAFLDNIKSGR